jgi:hypothetical protein
MEWNRQVGMCHLERFLGAFDYTTRDEMTGWICACGLWVLFLCRVIGGK